MNEFEAWAKELAHMIKDQRGYTPEQFEEKFLELWPYLPASRQKENEDASSS